MILSVRISIILAVGRLLVYVPQSLVVYPFPLSWLRSIQKLWSGRDWILNHLLQVDPISIDWVDKILVSWLWFRQLILLHLLSFPHKLACLSGVDWCYSWRICKIFELRWEGSSRRWSNCDAPAKLAHSIWSLIPFSILGMVIEDLIDTKLLKLLTIVCTTLNITLHLLHLSESWDWLVNGEAGDLLVGNILEFTILIAISSIETSHKSECFYLVGRFGEVLWIKLVKLVGESLIPATSHLVFIAVELWSIVIKFMVQLRETVHVRAILLLLEFIVLKFGAKFTLWLKLLCFLMLIILAWWLIRVAVDPCRYLLPLNLFDMGESLTVVRRSWPCLSLLAVLIQLCISLPHWPFSFSISGGKVSINIGVEPRIFFYL